MFLLLSAVLASTKPLPIVALVFDNDGLLMDSESVFARAHEAALGHPVDPEFRAQLIGRGGMDTARMTVEKYNLDVSVEEFWRRQNDELNRRGELCELFPGARPIIKFAKSRGLLVAVATSARRGDFDKKIARHIDFYNLFDVIVTGDDVNHTKPAPDLFLTAMAKLGIKDAATVLAFDDAPSGVKAANNAGMPVVMIPAPQLNVLPVLEKLDAQPTQIATSLLDVNWTFFELPPERTDAKSDL
jgi:pseudouridine-5'-monophosphatase